ncbi:MAG: Hsp20/alpha crystallin family protein [Bacteroidia bacterium]|nr:Hsp20/alpha crystallin family protein [Bacteroidia bacterium]
MNLTLKRSGGVPSLFSNLFGNSLFDQDLFDLDKDLFSSRLGITVPTANFTEAPKEYRIELAAPGLNRKDFDIEVDNHTLTIKAEKEEEQHEKEGEYTRREYSFSSFSRSFSLPENVKESDIDAKYENGVLKVTIPKVKETVVRPAKKVSVN